MKLEKKRSSMLLIISMLVCFLWTSNVQATEIKNVQQTPNQQVLVQKTIVVNSNQANETTQLPKRDKDAIDTLLKSKNPKLNTIGVGRFLKESKSNSSSFNTGKGINSVTLDYSISANKIDRTITAEVKISKVTGIPPVGLTVCQFIQNSDFEHPYVGNWYHSNINDNPVAIWDISKIYVGQKLSETVPAQTKWWGAFGSAAAVYENGTTDQAAWTTPYFLINRTGNAFPDYIDPWSGKKASDGLCTNWVKTSNPIKYGNDERGVAIASYIRTYGDPKYEWRREYRPNYYEMHHIQPRAFGGTNDLSNFIPIPCLNHQAISNWFAGYADPNAGADPNNE